MSDSTLTVLDMDAVRQALVTLSESLDTACKHGAFDLTVASNTKTSLEQIKRCVDVHEQYQSVVVESLVHDVSKLKKDIVGKIDSEYDTTEGSHSSHDSVSTDEDNSPN